MAKDSIVWYVSRGLGEILFATLSTLTDNHVINLLSVCAIDLYELA